MFCSRCGKEIDDSSAFCRHCGYKMSDTMPKDESYYYQNQVVSSLNSIDSNTRITAYSMKNKYVAGTLALLLGFLGVHNFYVGKVGKGLLQLGITIANFSVGIIFMLAFPILYGLLIFGEIFVIIWAIVESVKFFTDRGTDKYGKIITSKYKN